MAQIPDQLVEAFRANHRQLMRYERRTRSRLQELLLESMGSLKAELKGLEPGKWRRQQGALTFMMARALQEQGPQELERLISEIKGGTRRLGLRHVAEEIGAWQEHYGAEIRPINLEPVANLEATTLIEQYPRSLQRYGQDLARNVARELQRIPLEKINPDSAVEAIQASIKGARWRADRIVRTELTNAYNKGHLDGLTHARDSGQVPGLQKSAIATFDNRTDADSYPVHGQVRDLEANFVDGEGREYLHPPGRPNDREKEVPYIASSAELGGDPGEFGGTEISDREEGIKRAEEDKARLAARRKARATRMAKRKDRSRKARGLAPLNRGDTFESRRIYHQLWWANGSKNKAAIELKTSALEEFGLDGVVYNPNNHGVNLEDVAQARQDMRRVWRETVNDLLEDGQETLTLYRGVKSEYAVEGVLESYSESESVARKFAGRNGHVYKEEVDVRRVLFHHRQDWWKNGRFGQQDEFVVMPHPPRLRWDKDDWEIGFFSANELDDAAESAGQFGITMADDGTATLWHRPSGRSLLEGENFTRHDLREVAQDLDRDGLFTATGKHTARGEELLEDRLAAARIRYGHEIPEDVAELQAVQIDGKLYPLRNADVDPGNPETWSRRTFEIVDEDGHVQEVNGYAKKSMVIWREEEGVGYRGSWNLGHLRTGRRLHGGPEEFYEAGYRVPDDIGGWKKYHFEKWAEHFDQYFDPESGAMLDDVAEEFHNGLEKLREQWTAVDPADVPGLTEDSVDPLDDWDDWFPGANRKNDYVKPKTKAPRQEPKAPRKKEELSLEEAVKRRRQAMRKGRYNRYDDPDLEAAVNAEVKRLQEEELEERQRAFAKRERERQEREAKFEGREVEPEAHVEEDRQDRKRQELERRLEELETTRERIPSYAEELESLGKADATGEELEEAVQEIRAIRQREAMQEANRQAQQELRNYTDIRIPKQSDHMPGMNGSYVVDVQGPTGQQWKAVFKPTSQENNAFWGIMDGGQTAREVASGDLDAMFPGPRVVPPTIKAKAPLPRDRFAREPGSLQKFHPTATHDPREFIEELATAEELKHADFKRDGHRRGISGEVFQRHAAKSPASRKLAAMDVINGQYDRHGQNIMWTLEDGQLSPVGIDNGLGFVGYGVSSAPRSPFPMGREMWEATLDYFERELKHVDAADYARAALEAGVETQRVREAVIRLETLKERPRLFREWGLDATKYHSEFGWGMNGKYQGRWEEHVAWFIHESRTGENLLEADKLAKLEGLVYDLADEVEK